jgi:SAM-dependent methyltransferase
VTPTPVTACRACGSGDLHLVLSLGDQPPANALTAGPDDRVPAHPLDLVFCAACALAQLSVSLDPAELFVDYPYFSAFSPAVGEAAAALVARVRAERDLGPGDLVMEVASNDGYLLRHYVAADVDVLGIDPARNIAPAAEAAGVPTLADFFTLDLARRLAGEGRRAAVLHANNVLAHVPDVNDVVAGIATVLAPGGVAILETPSLTELVGRLEYDTIYHEHVYHYSAVALQGLLARHGLEVVDVEHLPIHGGTLRVTAAAAGERDPSPGVAEAVAAERAAGVDRVGFFADFARRVDRLRAAQRAFLDDAAGGGATVAGYGAAAKATVLLHAIGATAADVGFVVDRSPHKQGRHLPNTGIPVLDVDTLAQRRPDYALIFAWNFADEIVAQRGDYLEAGGRFVVPVPEVRVVAGG